MNKTKLKTLLWLGLLLPALSQALTLGDVSVRSYLMEPLRAEVPILAAAAEEIADLKLRIASQRDFERFGITRLPLHEQLRFEVRERDGRWLVEIATRVPVREPFVSIPVQALWRRGQMVREYTVLLDPRPTARPAVAAARTDTRPASRPAAAAAAAAQEYGPVRPGETLWPIAARLKPAGVNTEQMMMALLRANPDAFPGGNVNNLQAGSVLRVPARDEIQGMSVGEARGTFREQTAAWRGTSAEAGSTPPGAAAAADDVAEPAQLRILGRAPDTAEASDPAGQAEQRMLLSMERAAAERIELESLRVQVQQLEAEMAQMRRLLELKTQQMAALESSRGATAAAAGQGTTDAATAAPPALPPAVAVAPSAPAAPKPTLVVVPDRVVPPGAVSTLWHSWWTWAAAALFGLLALTLALVWARRRGAGGDLVLGQHPEFSKPSRPYAEQVARLGAQRSAQVAAPVAAGAAALHGEATGSRAGSEPSPAAPLRPELEDRPLQELAREMSSPAGISDDELESWVRDLADEADALGWPDEESEVLATPDSGYTDSDLTLPLEEIEATEIAPLQRLDEFEDQALATSDRDEDAAVLKLELARAYLEIGDNEGAREILTQLVEDSLSGPEQQEARRLLARLG